MTKNLNNMTKQDLLNIISQFKKSDLIKMIGGAEETEYAIKTPIVFNKNKVNNGKKYRALLNNNLYKDV